MRRHFVMPRGLHSFTGLRCGGPRLRALYAMGI